MAVFVRLVSSALLAALAACATPPSSPPDADKRQALAEFVVAYQLAQAWPRMAPKIAHDSLPRLEDATHAALDHDTFATPAQAQAAHARVAALLPQGRQELLAALQLFDAREFADDSASTIWAKYFDTAEIRQLTAFYASPTGRKLSALGPTLVAEHRKPGGPDPLDKHFDATEIAQIGAFWQSPVGIKMNTSAEPIREDMHALFMQRSEAAVQAVARGLATQAEAAR